MYTIPKNADIEVTFGYEKKVHYPSIDADIPESAVISITGIPITQRVKVYIGSTPGRNKSSVTFYHFDVFDGAIFLAYDCLGSLLEEKNLSAKVAPAFDGGMDPGAAAVILTDIMWHK